MGTFVDTSKHSSQTVLQTWQQDQHTLTIATRREETMDNTNEVTLRYIKKYKPMTSNPVRTLHTTKCLILYFNYLCVLKASRAPSHDGSIEGRIKKLSFINMWIASQNSNKSEETKRKHLHHIYLRVDV